MSVRMLVGMTEFAMGMLVRMAMLMRMIVRVLVVGSFGIAAAAYRAH
jgi:hypothetical protein